ncbi:hypothetical protein FB99_20240 [Pantoea agglomerans]|nr:hypothetical protein FB99_20240 [Pantoea agglomerans]
MHHYGLRDRPSINSKTIKYESRPLIGLNDKDRIEFDSNILKTLSKGF